MNMQATQDYLNEMKRIRDQYSYGDIRCRDLELEIKEIEKLLVLDYLIRMPTQIIIDTKQRRII